MPIPLLNNFGVLPPGIHEATIEETGAFFGYGNPNPRRQELWGNFVAFVDWIKPMKMIQAVYVDGSFITDKENPSDIDVVLELPPPEQAQIVQIDPRIFNNAYVKQSFNLDVYPCFPVNPHDMNDLRGFFQYVRVDDAQQRGMNPGDTKGIIKISL